MTTTQPIEGEEKYSEFDEATGMWGVYGWDSGFCYSTHCTEGEAEGKIKQLLKQNNINKT